MQQLLLGSGCGPSSSQRVARDGGVLVIASAVSMTVVTADTLHSSRGVRVLPTASVCIRKLI
jgi:hypothetical protein